MSATIFARRALAPLAAAATVMACGGEPSAANGPAANLVPLLDIRPSTGADVEFTGCVESIGVGLVSTQAARALTPTTYTLAGEGQPVTPFVARTARCDGIAVDGHKAKPGAIVQLGVVIVPPDGTGDINIYTLWYFSSDAKLAHRLWRIGVEAQHVPTLSYRYMSAAGSLAVQVRRPGDPQLSITGDVNESSQPAGSFTANWWGWSDGGRVKMTTHVPLILIGTADLVLRTAPNGDLGTLLGGGTAGFPILQQFNAFPSAHLAAFAAH